MKRNKHMSLFSFIFFASNANILQYALSILVEVIFSVFLMVQVRSQENFSVQSLITNILANICGPYDICPKYSNSDIVARQQLKTIQKELGIDIFQQKFIYKKTGSGWGLASSCNLLAFNLEELLRTPGLEAGQDGEVRISELTSLYVHIKTATTHRTTITENDLKTRRIDFLQVRI